jgi:hypothetical protein
LPQTYQTGLTLRGNRHVLPQGVAAHQPQVCAQHAARLGVKNRLMPRELAASVPRALGIRVLQVFFEFIRQPNG